MKKRQKGRLIRYKGHYLQLVERNTWEFIERVGCRGVVVVLAVTRDQEIVLTEQYRPPVARRVIEYPAGLVADGPHQRHETLNSAAKRELLEETGFQAARIVPLTRGPVSSGSSAVILSFVRAVQLKRLHRGGGDETEAIKVHLVPLKRLTSWLKKKQCGGALVDPKIFAGLYFLNTYNCKKFRNDHQKKQRSRTHGKSH